MKFASLEAGAVSNGVLQDTVQNEQPIYQFSFSVPIYWSRGSSVSIVSDYGLDDRGSIPDRGRGFFL
jgi:hypothetical protein